MRVERYVLEAIRLFAAAKNPPSTAKKEVHEVLLTAFKIKVKKCPTP